MFARKLVLVGAVVATLPSAAYAQTRAANPAPERAIRRELRITDMIRRAFAAGTRDSSGRPGRNYWQLRTEYTISARLDPATATVTGHERVVVHNNSRESLTSIQLRLDQNIFTANVPRLTPVPEITDGMKISRLAVDGVVAQLNPPPQQFRMGMGNPPPPTVPTVFGITQTSARVALSQAIPAGGSTTLEADWSFRVPLIPGGRGLRMGREADSVFQVAQWYPRVAVYDDLKGWDTDPYLGPAEFYNNFGHFDLSLDVPAGWLVGASGVLQNADQVLSPAARERLARVTTTDSVLTIVGAAERGPLPGSAPGARAVWHFVADTVGDVAWAASNRYIWRATRANIPGGGTVPIHLLYLPGDSGQYARAPELARHALEFYSRLWMPYAFPQLTLVDGPELGMEYPQIIFSAAGAADHEAGHEWWPMMVGVNETWWGFMDEGFNQYMNILSGADRNHQPPNLDGQGQQYGQVSGNELEPPLMWNESYAGPLYSFAAYGKAPLMLSMLGGIVGDSAVWRAMSQYAHAWRFKHPSPWDYAFFMSKALDRDLGWFWYYWLFTTESVDGSIQDVATSGGRTTVTVRQDGEMPSPVVLKVQFAPTGPKIKPMANATMSDSTTAVVTWPVDVWFNGSRTYKAVLDFGGRAIEKITLDPRCRFPDRIPGDNVWPRTAAAAAERAVQPGSRMRATCG